jgi:hypothetical protein
MAWRRRVSARALEACSRFGACPENLFLSHENGDGPSQHALGVDSTGRAHVVWITTAGDWITMVFEGEAPEPLGDFRTPRFWIRGRSEIYRGVRVGSRLCFDQPYHGYHSVVCDGSTYNLLNLKNKLEWEKTEYEG